MSEYIVSARKYRPDSFSSLIGQENIARTLKNSIIRGQLAHAYLFCGPRGVGKTSAARIFAKTINCSNPGPDMEPCGECESCRSFKEGRSYCIYELDAASNNGVEDIKALMGKVQIPPQTGRYSVYIIDEVHMLSTAAFNAFLKTLEEPPSHAIFILATTEKHKIIPTILSRCQTYDFNRIGVPDIVGNLRSIASKENVTIDEESLHVIADKADGAMRDALTIFDQTVAFCGTSVKYEDVVRNLNVLDYEYDFKLVDFFLKKDHAGALLVFDEILGKGFNAQYFISALGAHLRNLVVSGTGGLESLLDFPDSLRMRFSEQASRCSLKWLFDALQIVSQCESAYRGSTNQRLLIEFTLMRMAFLGGLPDGADKAHGPAPSPAPVQAPSAIPVSVSSPEPVSVDVSDRKGESAPQVEPSRVPETTTGSQPLVESATAPSSTDAPSVTSEPAPVEPSPRPRRSSSSLSLDSLLNEGDEMIEVVPDVTDARNEDTLPSDEELSDSWKQLAESQSQPRLASALSVAKLEFRDNGGVREIDFYVDNEAQKKWIMEHCLRNLEASIQKLTGCGRIRLNPVVTPESMQEKKAYLPQEKARELMEENDEVRQFVADLSLDI